MKIRFVHSRSLGMVLSLCMLFLGFSCGGGGGGGDGSEAEETYLNEYDFLLDLDLQGEDATQFQISTVTGGGSQVVVGFWGLPGNPLGSDLLGTMGLAEENDETVVTSMTVKETTIFLVSVAVEPFDVDPFLLEIDVIDPIEFAGGDDPVHGGFIVDSGKDNNGDGDTDDNDLIRVSFDENLVDLQLGSSAVDTYSMDDFMDLLDGLDPSPTWEEQAAAACASLEMLVYEVNFIAGMITKIESEELGTRYGDSNAGLSGFDTYFDPDPTGGTFSLTSASGTVEPGADFLVVYDRYWKDDPGDDVDVLIDGSVALNGYFRTDTDDVITEVGFAWGDDTTGVFYGEDGLAYYETEQTGTSGTPVEDLWWTRTVYGSYALIFIEP